MTPAMWIITLVGGVLLWLWLFKQFLSRDGYLDHDSRIAHVCSCLKGRRCLACMERDGLIFPKDDRRCNAEATQTTRGQRSF